jgi:hypothetical protein
VRAGEARRDEVGTIERRELRGAFMGPPEGGETIQLRLLLSGHAHARPKDLGTWKRRTGVGADPLQEPTVI